MWKQHPPANFSGGCLGLSAGPGDHANRMVPLLCESWSLQLMRDFCPTLGWRDTPVRIELKFQLRELKRNIIYSSILITYLVLCQTLETERWKSPQGLDPSATHGRTLQGGHVMGAEDLGGFITSIWEQMSLLQWALFVLSLKEELEFLPGGWGWS